MRRPFGSCSWTPTLTRGPRRSPGTVAASWDHLGTDGGVEPRGGAPQTCLRVHIALHRLVERALRVEQLEQRSAAGTVGVRGRVARLLGEADEIALDALDEAAHRLVLASGGADVGGDLGAPRRDLLSGA